MAIDSSCYQGVNLAPANKLRLYHWAIILGLATISEVGTVSTSYAKDGAIMRGIRLVTVAAWSLLLAVPMASYAQTTIFNSGGFESPYTIGNLNGQQGFVAQ